MKGSLRSINAPAVRVPAGRGENSHTTVLISGE